MKKIVILKFAFHKSKQTVQHKMKMIFKWQVWLVAIQLSASFNIHAQESSLVNQTTIIPFQLTNHNNIAIKAVLNGVDTVTLMFHTAANSLTVTSLAAQKITSIDWNGEDNIRTWGGKATARYSNYNCLEIGSVKRDSISIWETENSGPTTDGKFGPGLFAGNAIEIDFDKSIITLHKSLPPKAKEYEKMHLTIEYGLMFIQATSTINEVDYLNKFLIHSGFGGTLLFDDKFASKNRLGDKIEIIDEKELRDSYGSILKTKKGILQKLRIGQEDFDEIPIGFFEGAIGQQKQSVIGGDLLKRFNIIIDADREYVYLKTNHLINTPYTQF